MNCENISKMMTDCLAGEISEQDKLVLDAHIASCENCRKEFEQLKEIWMLTESALKADFFDGSLKPEQHQEIIRSAKPFKMSEPPKKSKILNFKWLEIAASIAICAILAGILVPAYFTKSMKISATSSFKQSPSEPKVYYLGSSPSKDEDSSLHDMEKAPARYHDSAAKKSVAGPAATTATGFAASSPRPEASAPGKPSEKLALADGYISGEKGSASDKKGSDKLRKGGESSDAGRSRGDARQNETAVKSPIGGAASADAKNANMAVLEDRAQSLDESKPAGGTIDGQSNGGKRGVALKKYGGSAAAKEVAATAAPAAAPAPGAAPSPVVQPPPKEFAGEGEAEALDSPAAPRSAPVALGGKAAPIAKAKQDKAGTEENKRMLQEQQKGLSAKPEQDMSKAKAATKDSLERREKAKSEEEITVARDTDTEKVMKAVEAKTEMAYEANAPKSELKANGKQVLRDEGQTVVPMETKIFKVKKDVLRDVGGSDEELLKYFKSKGISFGESCKLKYDPETGNLSISNMPDEMKKIEAVIKGLEDSYEKSKELKNGIPFSDTRQKPFSTFSIDVDTASYTMARKLLRDGVRPEPFSVRPEEFINFFDYHYRSPSNSTFAVYLETAPSAFRPENYTLRVGVKARELGPDGSRASVFTILIDASGSMSQANRMDLVKKSLPLLFDQLKPNDRIAVLACTHRVINLCGYMPASEKKTVSKLVEGIMPAGVADIENGLITAYDLALQNYEPGAYNRVILLTDGISNIGSPSAERILSKVSAARNMGITNTVVALGGDGDDKFLEAIANKGDGNYVFIDNEESAQEVFVNDFAGRFREIARDVKIQVEFNPLIVNQYRQIGYQNRQLSKADFRNDTVDAGEVGAGQSVTALYELKMNKSIPFDTPQTTIDCPTPYSICIVRLRYRRADNMDVEEKEFVLAYHEIKTSFAQASCGFRLASSVAEFAEFLRFPDVPGIANPENIMRNVQDVLGEDYRNDGKVSEFYTLVKNVK